MPRAGSRRRPPRAQVAARILDAAVAVIAKRGFEATTMQEIAAGLGMTAPALYHYFDSKQILLYEMIVRTLERFLGELDAAVPSGTPPVAALERFVRAHLTFQLEGVDRARVYNSMFLGTDTLLDTLTARQRAEIIARQGQVRQRLRSILQRGIASGDFDVPDLSVTTMAILAMGEFAVSWFPPGGRLTMSAVTEESVMLAHRMVGGGG